VRDGRNTLRALLIVCLALARPVSSHSDNPKPPSPGKKPDRYDGVGLEVMPKPARSGPKRVARAVWTTRGPHLHFDLDEGYSARKYATYLQRAANGYQSPRWKRVTEAVKSQVAKHTRRFARRIVRRHFRAGPEMDQDEFRKRMEQIERIGRSKPPRWRVQYDEVDPILSDRYEREWDDTTLIVWGPLVVTDSGAVDLDFDLDNLKRLWKVDLEDIEIVPPPPDDKPPPLLGQRVRFNTNIKIRISSSRLLKPFLTQKPGTWLGKFLNAGRYVRLRAGVDLYTDITKRRYFGSELEVRLYRDLRWAAFLNVVVEGH